MSSKKIFLLCLLILIENNYVNCEEIDDSMTTPLDDYEYSTEETDSPNLLNDVSDEVINVLVKSKHTKDDNILVNWSKLMTNLTDSIWSKLLPIALRYQYESSNVSVECTSSLLKLLFGFKSQQTWAAKFFDAIGKLPSGVLDGTVTSLGDYDQCLDIEVQDSDDMGFHGKYCLLYLNPELPPKPRIIQHRDHVFNLTGTEAEGTLFEHISNTSSGIYSVNSLRFGICIPSTCQNYELQLLGSQLMKDYKLNASVSQKCATKIESTGFTVHQKVSLSLFILMASLLVIGTFIDYYINNSYSEWFLTKIFVCWSARRNIRKLVSTEVGNQDLSAIHGIRVLTMIWVTVNHTYLFGGLYKIRWIYRRLLLVTKVAESLMFQLVFNAWVLVDSFFFISGLLIIYGILPLIQKNKGKVNIALLIWHRFIRIVPSLCGIIGLQLLWPLVFTGPMLIDDKTDYYLIKSCENNWWKNLLLINNWFNPDDICLISTWHVSVDFQMFLGSIIILLTFYWNATYGLILNGAVLLISIICSAIVTYSGDLYPTIFNDHTINLDYIQYHLKYSYLPTYQHLGPYCIGILTGFFILNKHKTFQISKKANVICWTCLPALSLFMILMSYNWNRGVEPNVITSVLYSSLHRSVWCIGLAWITYNCAVGIGGIINRLLSSPIFVPLSRLSFGVYLTHLVVIYMRYFTQKSTIFWSHFDFLCNSLVHIILSNVLAVVLYLLLEAPFVNLEKLVFANKEKKSESLRKVDSFQNDKLNKNYMCPQKTHNDSQNNEDIFYVIKL